MMTPESEQLARFEASRNAYEKLIAIEEEKLATAKRRLISLTMRRCLVQMQIESMEGRKMMLLPDMLEKLMEAAEDQVGKL